MDYQDFGLLHKGNDQCYLERPALTVNMVFCFSNPGVSDSYQKLTEALTQTWGRRFNAEGEHGSVGVQ